MKRLAFLLYILVGSPALAVLNANMAWDVRTGGDNTNGGAYRGAANLAAPAAPSVACPTTGGTVAAGTYYIVAVYADGLGRQGPVSTATSVVCTGATSSIVTTSPAASPRAVFYAVYIGTANLPGPWFPNPGTSVAIGTDSTRTTTPATTGTQPAGADYSQQDAAQHSYTDIVAPATKTTGTSVARPFVPLDVGNTIDIVSGLNCTVQTVEIIAVSAANLATFDKTLGASANICSGKFGGGHLTITGTEALAVASNSVYVKRGTYNETLTLTVSGGNGSPRNWIGYDAAHGDDPTGDNRPLIDATGLTNGISTVATLHNAFYFFRVANATAVNITGSSGRALFHRCKSSAAGTDGWAATSSLTLQLDECESTGNTDDGLDWATGTGGVLQVSGSNIHDNGGGGIENTGVPSFSLVDSLIEANGATNITAGTGPTLMVGNTVDGASGGTSDGIQWSASSSHFSLVKNNAVTNNGRYGENRTASGNGGQGVNDYNGYYGNATAALNTINAGPHDVSTDPGYVNAAGGNFAIGPNWRAAGSPGAIPGSASTSYLDIGSVQRQEPNGCSVATWAE